MNRRFIVTIITLIIVAVAAVVVTLLAKGYTFSPKEGKLVGTGIITVTSVPDGALVYIDGHLTTATNTTLSQLKPKTYDIKIVKEGFIPWQKQIQVTEGLVSEAKATLFPALPTIYPLTFNGIINVALSPDGQKLAFSVPFNPDILNHQKGGVWVWTMGTSPISFSRGAEPHQLVASTTNLDFSKANLRWSPDSKSVLAQFYTGDKQTSASERNYLLPFDRQTNSADLRDITPIVAGTLKEWEDDQKTRDDARVLTISDLRLKGVASSSAFLRWAPDETKFISGQSKESRVKSQGENDQSRLSTLATKTLLKGFKVYDVVMNRDYNLPEAYTYLWLPDSRHVILVQQDKIGIADFDGTNVAEVFAGKFEGVSVFPWPDSSRLVVLTSFNTQTGSTPNLFGINLK